MPTRDLTYEEIGNDISTTVDGDLDLSFEPITGSKVVAEGVVRRWFTKRGRCFWAPFIGRDAAALINSDLTAVQIERAKVGLAQEALGVDGCKGCRVVITRDEKAEQLQLQADIDTAAGKADVNVAIGNAGQIIAAQIRVRNGR